ncbi:tripartite tricarboxylate transporter TctB family protein [Methyloversatilis universalis]|uniref:tripartite tricarboxylate transporter TctB family protein n=1 Tax=Methyloversatilis universalis TaxID=378211 RepID=UPI000362C78C|nr:tripartite tricarboxylate transporter TctB family protein [Methyloversatilis universalis]
MERSEDAAEAGMSNRWPEILVALFLFAIGVIVVSDSIRVGTGWEEGEGPRAGYFPFYIGSILLISSGWILIGALARIRKPQPQFATWEELRSVMQMLVPLSIYIVAVVFLGLYVSSFVLIAYFMKVHGKFGVIGTVLTSVGVPLAAFMLFERWFLVPLPKGPLELMLGL